MGRGRNLLPLVYVDNAVDAMILAATSEKAAVQVYNLIDDFRVTQREYLDKYCQAIHAPMVIVPVPLSLPLFLLSCGEHLKRSGILTHVTTPYGFARQYPDVVIDASKTKRELGWQPRIGLEEGLLRTFSMPAHGV